MATLATFIRDTHARRSFGSLRNYRNDTIAVERHEAARAQAADPCLLRALPNDDVYFYSKKIDNSRVIRQADPEACRFGSRGLQTRSVEAGTSIAGQSEKGSRGEGSRTAEPRAAQRSGAFAQSGHACIGPGFPSRHAVGRWQLCAHSGARSAERSLRRFSREDPGAHTFGYVPNRAGHVRIGSVRGQTSDVACGCNARLGAGDFRKADLAAGDAAR
jgi:hypothetical protein